MWILKWTIFAVIVILMAIFCVQNIATLTLLEKFSLNFFSIKTPSFPVFLWLLFSFFTGGFLIMFIFFIREIKFHTQIAILNSKISDLEQLQQVDTTNDKEIITDEEIN